MKKVIGRQMELCAVCDAKTMPTYTNFSLNLKKKKKKKKTLAVNDFYFELAFQYLLLPVLWFP